MIKFSKTMRVVVVGRDEWIFFFAEGSMTYAESW